MIRMIERNVSFGFLDLEPCISASLLASHSVAKIYSSFDDLLTAHGSTR